MHSHRHNILILLAMTACSEVATSRDVIPLDTSRSEAPVATWAGVLDGRLAAPHCWTPNGEGAVLAIGFDGDVEHTAGVFSLAVALDGVPLGTEPQGSGRFVAIALPVADVAPGFHTLALSGSVDAEVTILYPQAGDANCDGRFASDDLVAIFAAGHYESPASDAEIGWAEGDFDGDGKVGTGDLVMAYAAGNYESPQPYALAAHGARVLGPDTLGTMVSAANPELPSLVDVLEGTLDVAIEITAADFDPEEDLYTVAFPLQELPELHIGVRLDADETGTLIADGSLAVAIDFANARYTTADAFNIASPTLLESFEDDGDARTVCGDVWFRGDDGEHEFVGRGTSQPLQMLGRQLAAEAKKGPPAGGGLGGVLTGFGAAKEAVELLPLDTCGVYVPFGVCPASLCAHSRGDKVAFSYCDAGTYGVSPGAINLCACK